MWKRFSICWLIERPSPNMLMRFREYRQSDKQHPIRGAVFSASSAFSVDIPWKQLGSWVVLVHVFNVLVKLPNILPFSVISNIIGYVSDQGPISGLPSDGFCSEFRKRRGKAILFYVFRHLLAELVELDRYQGENQVLGDKGQRTSFLSPFTMEIEVWESAQALRKLIGILHDPKNRHKVGRSGAPFPCCNGGKVKVTAEWKFISTENFICIKFDFNWKLMVMFDMIF